MGLTLETRTADTGFCRTNTCLPKLTRVVLETRVGLWKVGTDELGTAGKGLVALTDIVSAGLDHATIGARADEKAGLNQ
jgi:hypothetical protein